MSSRVVGLDPSLSATGVADADGNLVVAGGDADAGDRRLLEIYRAVVATLPADLVVLEDLPTHAHGAGKTGMVQGVIRMTLLSTRTRYVVVTPATLKKFATGRGTATKPDMRMALFQRSGLDVRNDNKVDAFWLRELGLHLLGEGTMKLPATHTAALAKVEFDAQAPAAKAS